jgi:hypothetical protein
MEIQQASYHRWDIDGEEKQTVTIKVTESLARWLEENPAHPTQQIDGELVTYRVTNPKAMARWVVGLYGLEVLEPPELRQALKEIAQELSALYDC